MTKLISSIEYILIFFLKWRMRILSAVFGGKIFLSQKALNVD